MENIFPFNQFPKKIAYFQEFPVILNSFLSKHLNKFSSPQNQNPLHNHQRDCSLDITLPRLSSIHENYTPKPFQKQNFPFYIQGYRKKLKKNS